MLYDAASSYIKDITNYVVIHNISTNCNTKTLRYRLFSLILE